MQEFPADDPCRCSAVTAGPGEVVIVLPGWVHAALSAEPETPLTFGAWCEPEYGFEYQQVGVRGGLAWYAVLDNGGLLKWHRNANYMLRELRAPLSFGWAFRRSAGFQRLY